MIFKLITSTILISYIQATRLLQALPGDLLPVDTCSLRPETGFCKAYFQRYYYDSQDGECKIFIYGGCGGNDNNFETKKECMKQCKPKDVCSLPPATGPCKALFPGFYYDKTSGQCTKFTYGGCRGNKNFFKTLKNCENRCVVEETTTESPIHIVPNDFDWAGALAELNRRKALWQNNDITKYLYHFEKYCYCKGCDVAGKYIEIKGGVATLVQFDDTGISNGCSQSEIYTPIEEHYFSVDKYFDIAIDHATRGMNAQCVDDHDEGLYAEAICGGSAKIEYDPVLNYPAKISLSLGPMIMDGNIIYTIDCLTVMHVNGQDAIIPNYDNNCPDRFFAIAKRCRKYGEKCEITEDCCDSYCVDLKRDGNKQCWLE